MHIRLTPQMRMPVVARVVAPSPEVVNEGALKVANMALNYFAVLNELSMQEFLKCYNKLFVKPYYKHELKKKVKDCKKELARLLSAAEIWIAKGDKDKYYSYVDYCDEELRNNIEDLRTELSKFFKRKGVIEYELWADIEVNYIVLKEGAMAFSEIVDFESKKAHANLSRVVWDMNPNRAHHLMKTIRHLVHDRQPEIFIDANESRMSIRAYKRLKTKLANYYFTKRAMKKAEQDHEGKTET